jgi:capsular polysaccharide biosynthesis protein
MCGVHSAFWAHFLVQYLPKLFFLKEIQSVVSQRITVILPPYKDEQIREIVCSYLKQLKNINIIELKKNSIADCKILYHLENTSHISDHSNFFNPSDVIIPRITLDLLKKSFVDQYLASNTLNNSLKSTPFRKLYIGRTGNRNIINKEEVENYFSKLGYDLVYPHKLSLEEKVKTFREADVIAGVLSSGFTNIMFCRPGTKILAFTNFQRTFDCYISTISKYYALDLMVITGTDTDDSIHSSFRIHLDKIKSAYSEFVLKEIR